EVTKHVSIASLRSSANPSALLSLRGTGACEVTLDESLFDLDFPGQYMRRVKSVSLTVPCVTGPYAGVNCKLTLLKSSVRHDGSAAKSYPRDDSNGSDTRFTDYLGAIESIVTSSGQNDSGLFETNLRDERYLPF